MDRRDRQLPADRRQAGSKAGPQQAAAREGVERLDRLEAGPERIRPRIQPGRDAVANVREDEREEDEPDEEEPDPQRHVHLAAGREVEEAQEHRVEEEGRAEVLLDDDDPQGQRQHEPRRQEVRGRWHGQAAHHADARVGEEDPVLREVGGEEHHQDHLEQLRRLPAHGPEVERQPRAVHIGPKHEGERQQPEARRRPRVLVQAEPAIRAHRDRDDPRDREREDQPDELERGQPEDRRTDALDHQVLGQSLGEQQADAAQQPHRGEQDLVYPTPRGDEREVHGDERPEVDEQPGRVDHRQAPGARETQRQVPEGQRRRDSEQEAQLATPDDRPREARQGGRGHRSPRSRRIRTSPIWSSSPKPSGSAPATGTPLTSVPFVLPRSSTYQPRPR